MRAPEAGDRPARPGYVFAVVPDRVRCDELVRDLTALGLGDEAVTSFVGDEGAAELLRASDAVEAVEEGGFWTHLAHVVEGITVAEDDRREYAEAARAGSCVVAFRAGGDLALDRVARLLQTHAAGVARFYGADGETETLAR